MNNKNIILLIAGLLIVGGGIFYLMNQNSGYSTSAPASSNNNNLTPNPSPTPKVQPAPAPIPAPYVSQVIHNISIQGFAFSPASITIRKGDTIVWKNMDSTPHTVTGGDLNSKPLATNDTYSFVYGKTGVFPYYCSIHPSMKGTVTVTN